MLKFMKKLIFNSEDICYFCKENIDSKRQYICYDCYNNFEIANNKLDRKLDNVNNVYYSLEYNRYMKEKIRDFKFHNKHYLHRPFGDLLIDTILHYNINEIDLVLSVPMYIRKERKRGYNQSNLLAKYICKKTDLDYGENNLVKTVNTKPQSSLDYYERGKNLKGVFAVKDISKIENKNILLIDDILTTGNTIEECGRTLKKAGAKEINTLVLTANEFN